MSKRVLCMARAYVRGGLAAISLLIVGLVSDAIPPAKAQGVTHVDGAKTGPICVVVPHFKDEYWLSVGFGLVEEAKVTGAEILLYESGGYHALQRQISLLSDCVDRGARAILLGAVSADAPQLLNTVEMTAREVPVVALVNALNSNHLSGAVGVDWGDMGRVIGQFMNRIYPEGQNAVPAALITGPDLSGWSPLLEAGLWTGAGQTAARFDFIGRSDTGLREQLAQVEQAMISVDQLAVLVGSAPAIEGAMGLLANADAEKTPVLISTYVSHSVRRGLQSGAVRAVAFDDPIEQGRLGIRLALAAERGTFTNEIVGPEIQLITAQSDAAWQIELAPAMLELRIE
ncbi:TMAO reductase system periplasmic protein TorT [Aliiroseovarius sp. KMU-50]|uniref:TMAO reductase system periplasmic protein TorT n=1 Tax=Aliiroseovarius salicola TaxID=3009082 RepID=A0ABT4W6B9_9RHOB|nr:TMAO reductase system periplasmic protein TorT [Aliiroseovarius sp. KMU-50]MDA5095620.1 TMAO reductase system periplasmic protein TorT [Aliiroseovarius sp. KMU-50]